MDDLLTPYPPNTPLLAPVGNIPWSRWFTDLRRLVNGLLTDVTTLSAEGLLTGVHIGEGDPNGVVVGNLGDLYRRTDALPALYLKEESGTAEGWAAVRTAPP